MLSTLEASNGVGLADGVRLVVCVAVNDLGAEGGTALAEAFKSCPELRHVGLAGEWCGVPCCQHLNRAMAFAWLTLWLVLQTIFWEMKA